MDNTVALIVAIVGVVTGLGGLVTAWRTARASARKDEVDVLRSIIEELRKHDEAQGKELVVQAGQIARLEVEVRAWKRRFERVCRQFGVSPDAQITGGLGVLREPGAQSGGNG